MNGIGFGAPIVQVYHEKSMILPDVSRVLACLYEKDVEFETHTTSNKSLLRLQASSLAPVPFHDGPTFLEESREICRYIAEKYEHHGNPFLLGKDALERASVEQWLHHEEHAFNPPSRALFCHLAFPPDEEDDGNDIDMHTRKLEEVLDVYEQRLGDSKFLVGDKFTLADLVHLPNSHYIKTSNEFLCLYDSRKNVRRWWDAISDRDSWKKVLSYMESVKNQNKQELYKQQQQKEDPRASSHPIQSQVYSRKQVSTEPQTISVSPADSSRATGVDSQFKEAATYSTPTPQELETTGSKLQTTDVHRRLQAEQWHAATTGLSDIKQDADRLMSTGQGKLSNDVQQYQLQDSEQATSHPVPQEPMGMELVQGREKIARGPYTFFLNCRPYTDQSRDILSPLPQQTADAQEIVEDDALSGKRGAVPSSSTQEHGVSPPRQAADKDDQSMIPSQAEYPGGQDTRKQHRDHGSVSTPRAVQDARATFDESKASNFTISNERFSYASQSSPRQDLDGARHNTAPSEQRYPGFEDTSKQAEDKISTPRQMADQDAEDTTEETKISESSSSRVQHLYVQRPDTPSRKQEKIEDPHSATSAIQRKDTSGLSRDTGSWQIAPDGGIDETKLVDSTPPSAKPMYTQQYSLPPRKAKVEDANDKGRHSRVTIAEPQKMVSRDAQATHEETKTGTPGHQSSDRLQASPQPSPAAAKGARSVQFPEMLDTKKSRGTIEETKGPGSTLSRAQSLGAQRTNGEYITPSDDERKVVPTQLHTDAEDQFQQSKLSDIGQKDLGSLSSQERDVKDAQAITSEQKTVSTERLREITKTSESPGSFNVGKTSSVYPEKPPFAQAGEDGSTLKHSQASDVPYTFVEKLSTRAPAKAKGHDEFVAEGPFRKDITNDQTAVPPLLSNEPTFQVQTTESSQEAASRGGLPAEPSTIEQWQRTSVPLNDDVTSSSGGDEIGMATIDQKLAPMSQQGTPTADGVNQMAKESVEQRVELPLPIEAETSGVPSASSPLPGASTAHPATDEKSARQSIIVERAGEVTKIQASIPDSSPAHLKGATPDGQEIGDSELVSTTDGQISEAAKTRHDEATLHEDVHDANLSTHYLSKDAFKETKVADSTPHSAKPMYTQQTAPTPRHAEAEDTREKGTTSRGTIDLHKIVERRAGTAGEQVLDRRKAIPPSRQAAADDAHGATGDTVQSPDILETFKKTRATYEEAKGPGSILSKPQSLGAQYAQRNTGESATPTAGQRKEVSAKPQPDVKDGLEESKLSVADWNGLRSLSSEGKDGLETETTITEEKTLSTGKLREPHKKSESTTPKAHPTDLQGSVEEEKAPSIYQKQTLVAKDSQERDQTIPAGENADGSTPKHQQDSYAVNTSDEKLNASELPRAKSHGGFSEDLYREDTTDGQKVAPPLLSRELTSQVQPPSEPSHDADSHGDLSSQSPTIDQWRRASVPLHDVTPSSVDDEMAISTVDQKLTSMSQQESGEGTLDEQKFTPSDQDSSEPRSKEIEDLSPSTQLNYTTEPRNGDAIIAAPGQAKDSQETPRGQFKLSAPSSYTHLPSGEPQEDEPADNLGEVRSSKPSSVEEVRSAAAVPVSAPDTQHGAAPDEVTVDEQKFAPSGQGSAHATFTAPVPDTQSGIELDKEDVGKQKVAPSGQHSVHYVQPSFSTEPTKENTVADAADQTSTLEKVIDQNYMTPALDKVKTPFSGTPYASRKTQKGTDDDHIDEKLPSQWRVSPDKHVSESPKGLRPEAHSDVDKKATPGSSQAETLNNVPDSTAIYGDAHLSSSDVPAESSLPETQDLQGSASAQNVPADPLGNIESPTYLSTDQVMAPKMSPTIPSVAPLGTVPGTNSVQAPQQASTVDLESAPDTQHGMSQGRANPAEQKFTISDQEPAHISEPRKEEGNAAAGDQPNVPQGPETTDQHQVKAPSQDAREPLQKDRQPSHAVRPSDLHDGPTSEVHSAVVDKETPLMLSQDQTSAAERNSTLTSGDVPPTSSLKKREAEPPAATQAPTSQVLQSSALAQNDSLGNIESPRQASADQVMVPAINSAAPSDAPQVTEPGQNSSQPLQPPFSTETTKESTVVTADDQAKDMKTITHQQAITPAPGTAKTPFPSTQDASRTIQESIDNGRIDELLPNQEQVSLMGSNSELREAQTAEPYGTHVDEKTTKSPLSQANISDSESGLERALGDVVPSTGEGLSKISSPERGAPTQLPAATQDVSFEASSKAKSTGQGAKALTGDPASVLDTQPGSSQTQGEAAPGEQNFAVSDKEYTNASTSVPSAESRKEKTNAANVDQMSVPHTAVTHQVTSSTPDASEALSRDHESSRDDDGIRNLADPLIASQEEDTTVAAADQAEGMQTIAHQQAISPAPGASNTPVPSIQDASRTIQESTADDGHVDEPLPSQEQVSLQGNSGPREEQTTDPYGTNIDEKTTTFPSIQANISDSGSGLAPTLDVVRPSAGEGPAKISFPESGEQTQIPAATQDVSFEASTKAKSTGQGAKALTGDPASVLDTQPGSSQTQGEAAPAEQNFAVTDKKSANGSKSPFSAEPREEQTNVANEDQTSVPETTITNQAASAKPDASDTLEKNYEFSRDDDHISNSANLVVSEEAASGRASEESSDAIDKNMTLPSSETQTSSTGPDPTPKISDAYPSNAGVPATSSVQNQDLQPPATQALTTQALQGSPSFQIVPDSLEKLNSPTLPSTMAPVTSPATPLGASQGTEPGAHSWPKGRMESSEKTGNQQQADQAIVEPLEGSEKQAEQIKRHDSETIEPEDMEASENTNQKNNRRSLVETLGHSGKQASGVQQLGENTKDVPNFTDNAPGDVQADSKSEDSSRSSEESKVLQSEDKNQGGETESPSSGFGHPIGRGFAANSYQNNSSQSQAAAPDKPVEQSSPDIQNKGSNSSRLDGSTNPTKPTT